MKKKDPGCPTIRIQEEAKQIKLHNQRNAKQRIQRKKFLESQKVKVETPPTPKKVWQKKVSSPKTPSGDDNQTKGMECPAPDSKPEPSPLGMWHISIIYIAYRIV